MVTHQRSAALHHEAEARAWALSGMRWLTGPPSGGGLGPPSGLIAKLATLEARIAASSDRIGRRVSPDGLGALSTRAAVAGLRRQGTTSCGGGTRLLQAGDGWLALSLTRHDDVELVPAWLEADAPRPGADLWRTIEDVCSHRSVGELVARGVMLGLPISALAGTSPHDRPAVVLERIECSSPDRGRRPLRVADLSALWAGPLCGRLFAAAGAQVIKVESTARPDGARFGPAAFFEMMDRGKEHMSVDLSSGSGRAELAAALRSVDVVIESSRPRAMEQMGLDARALLAEPGGPSVWISITGHGRDGPSSHRVAFGDDAAVAGGLVSWDAEQPYFCGDAVADPLAGLTAAATGLEAVAGRERVLIDVSMASVAAHFAGPTCPAGPETARRPQPSDVP